VARSEERDSVMRLRFVMASIVLAVLAASVWGQGSPRVTSVEPTAAKIGATVTVHGENLSKGNVAAVFVSNSSDDFPATVVEQSDAKIVIKIPKVKAGDYNVSIQVKNDILIQPIRLAVQE
jgi:hypothetical protein